MLWLLPPATATSIDTLSTHFYCNSIGLAELVASLGSIKVPFELLYLFCGGSLSAQA